MNEKGRELKCFPAFFCYLSFRASSSRISSSRYCAASIKSRFLAASSFQLILRHVGDNRIGSSCHRTGSLGICLRLFAGPDFIIASPKS